MYGAKLISQQSQLICLHRECHTFMAHYVHRNFQSLIRTQARFNAFVGFLNVRIYLIHRKSICRAARPVSILWTAMSIQLYSAYADTFLYKHIMYVVWMVINSARRVGRLELDSGVAITYL